MNRLERPVSTLTSNNVTTRHAYYGMFKPYTTPNIGGHTWNCIIHGAPTQDHLEVRGTFVCMECRRIRSQLNEPLPTDDLERMVAEAEQLQYHIKQRITTNLPEGWRDWTPERRARAMESTMTRCKRS